MTLSRTQAAHDDLNKETFKSREYNGRNRSPIFYLYNIELVYEHGSSRL